MGEITIRQSQAENWSFARIKLPGNAPDDNVRFADHSAAITWWLELNRDAWAVSMREPQRGEKQVSWVC